jgi:Mitochondrial carrier protein
MAVNTAVYTVAFLCKSFLMRCICVCNPLVNCEQWLLERRRNTKPNSYTNSSYSNINGNSNGQTALQRHTSNVIPSKMSMSETFIAGSFAGACQMAIVLPADNIKTKLQVSALVSSSLTSTSCIYYVHAVYD